MSDKTKDPNQFVLPLVRLSYAKLFKAEGFKGADENKKFSCNFILDKEKHAGVIKKMKARIAEILKENKVKLKADKIFLKDGDGEGEAEEVEGCYFLAASNSKRPQTIRSEGGSNVPVTEDDANEMDILYSGCYVDGVIRVWYQDNQWGKRINASLEVTRHRKSGEKFGAGNVNADDVLDDLPEDDDCDLDDI